jgi:hypothetical protein
MSSTATSWPPPRRTPRPPVGPRTSPSATTWSVRPPARGPPSYVGTVVSLRVLHRLAYPAMSRLSRATHRWSLQTNGRRVPRVAIWRCLRGASKSERNMASIASLYGAGLGDHRAGFSAAAARPSSAPGAPCAGARGTPCRRANSWIDSSSTRASRRIAANNSTSHPIPTPPVLEIHPMGSKAQVGPDQTVTTTPASRTWGQTRPHGGATATCLSQVGHRRGPTRRRYKPKTRARGHTRGGSRGHRLPCRVPPGIARRVLLCEDNYAVAEIAWSGCFLGSSAGVPAG